MRVDLAGILYAACYGDREHEEGSARHAWQSNPSEARPRCDDLRQ